MKMIDKLSLPELESLLIAAQKRKALLSSRRPLSMVRKELVAMARSDGYEIGELFDCVDAPRVVVKRARTPKRRKIPAKYLDPENQHNTWSGRGRMPRWLADKVRRGGQAADYLIPGLAKPTVKNARLIGQRTVYKSATDAG